MGLRVRGRLTELRPATADDVERLCAWHADPEVARFWDDETFTRHLLASGRDRVTVDPYEWNESAIRAWRRAGFVEISRGHPPDDDHTSVCVLMEYRES